MDADCRSCEQILARALADAGGPAWARASGLHLAGRVTAGGLSGPTEQWIDLVGARHAMRLELGPAAMAAGFDGHVAWQRGANGEVVVQDAEAARRAAATDAWIHARGWWFAERHPAAFEALGRREADGRAFDVVGCTPVGGQRVALWFDAVTHRLDRLVQEQLGRPATRRFDHWREVDGLWLPFRVRSGNGDPRFDRVTESESVQVDATPPPGTFEVPVQAFTDVAFAGGASSASIPVEIANHHVFVPVTLDGHALRFMLDTGGVNLVAEATARRIGLASVGAMEARGPGERSVSSGFARVGRLDLGGAVALERQLLRVIDMPGFDAVEGLRVDGVLGVELFKRLVVQIDYAGARLTLADPAAFEKPPSAHSLPLSFFGHFPGVVASLDGIEGQFWLDTGNRGGLVLHRPFVEAHGLDRRYRTSAETTIGWGIGGRAQGRLARGGRLALGALGVDAPVLRLPLGHDGPLAMRDVAGNIGGEILGRFVVAFDYARRVVHLAPAPGADRPFAADRSGLWINAHPRGAVVAGLMAGGPADEAGLRVDDVIEAVDGRAVEGLGLAALRGRLAEAGGRIAVEVRRGSGTLRVALRLRDLV
ncbi:MAG: aspartyl protease family protein [Burkholderiales bacterium]|nr:aspartyl protease family protein [Burkholderiales bacterium]